MCRWFRAKNAARWWGVIQDTTFRPIRAWHVSIHRLEGPPEQGTDILKDMPRANDKWAQRTTHQDKTGDGWRHWVAGRPPWSADGPVGPIASVFHMSLLEWLLKSVQGGLAVELQCKTPSLPPIKSRGRCKWRHATPHLVPLLLHLELESSS